MWVLEKRANNATNVPNTTLTFMEYVGCFFFFVVSCHGLHLIRIRLKSDHLNSHEALLKKCLQSENLLGWSSRILVCVSDVWLIFITPFMRPDAIIHKSFIDASLYQCYAGRYGINRRNDLVPEILIWIAEKAPPPRILFAQWIYNWKTNNVSIILMNPLE